MRQRIYDIVDNSTKELRSIDTGRSVFNQPTNYWPLQIVHSETANFFTSDVSLFLDEKRLAKLNPYDINNMVQGLQNQPKSPSLDDATLFETIPTRHLQSVGDVHAYADALEADTLASKASVESKVREINELRKQALVESKTSEPTEPSKTE